jgi:ketosteroid isomerase-like protein
MWDERISTVQGFTDAVTARDIDAALEFCHPEIEFFSLLAQLEARPYRGFAGIRRYFKDIDAAWEEWRVDVEQLLSTPDGSVAIVMSTHMRGKGSGLAFAERVAVLWRFKEEKLWRATLYRDPADALRATRTPPPEK